MGRFDWLLRPRSILVVGGGTWGAEVLRQCQKIGFQGDLWVLHPTKDEIAGLKPYRKLTDLPRAPDAVYVGVNRHATIDVVRDLRAMGAGGAVCFASGFQEALQEDAAAADLQAALLEAAGDMPIVGPNCYGFLNYLDGVAMWPDQHGGVMVESGVALITQSSNIAINLTMQRRGLPISYVITVGNQAQTTFAEVGLALLDDPRVTALGLHIEGIGDLRAFESLARQAHEMGKPIVALKVGRSAQARAATVSHTAALAGSDAGAQALFARLGVGQVETLSGFLETLKLLHVVGPLPSTNVASMSCSGGEASLMADAAHDSPVTYPPLSDAQTTALRAVLGPMVALANPLDYYTYIWGDVSAMAATFGAMMDARMALGLVVLDFPRGDRCSIAAWKPVIAAVAEAQETSGKPIALLSSLVENMPEDVAQDLVARRILPFCGISEAIEAISLAAAIGQAVPPIGDLLLPAKTPAEVLTLGEAEAKDALATYGLTVPRSCKAESMDAVTDAAARVGYPVVLKGEGFAHKTEAAALALDLATPEAVMAAASAMPVTSFLVEEMVAGAVAELLIGVVSDPAHGYVLTLAAGGVMTELMDDRVSLLLPVDLPMVRSALGKLRVFPVLQGYRGKPGADIAAIIDAVMAVQAYVTAHRPQEVEVNPLICREDGAIAADALIVKGVCDD
ncbi:acetate--CoA ligase family protein [Cognatiyoonia sp. IB215182]|uniref:acetate--CoA ligase family protein n=1 Tax=Cognatiyoonia sp. IB215182 TaxID=3097353 RepID=UPI002A183317|nr:acetate--CoA ligase family protein [Cognatiyoonia sp. IB215182]MDX8351828.1 acetate--CoA ligase family protein [Cognatiyoonia sp. IB215182]